jgi:hypothetical protein
VLWLVMVGIVVASCVVLVGMAVHSLRSDLRIEVLVAKREEYIMYWRTLAHLQRRLRRVQKILDVDQHDER